MYYNYIVVIVMLYYYNRRCNMKKETAQISLTESGKCLVERLKEQRAEREKLETQEDTVIEIPWYARYMDRYQGQIV